MTKGYMDRGLFFIEKRVRKSPTESQTVSVYYVLDFVIYQAPTLASVINTRVNNAIFFTKKAYEIAAANSEILYSKPYTWASLNAKSEESSDIDFIFEDAQHNLNQVHAIKKNKAEKPNAKTLDSNYLEEIRS